MIRVKAVWVKDDIMANFNCPICDELMTSEIMDLPAEIVCSGCNIDLLVEE